MQSFAVEDFTGGLNLRADVFNLARNESPDLLNVDIDPRGGVFQRRGMLSYNSAAVGGLSPSSWSAQRVFAWNRSTGTPQVLLAAANKVFYSTTGAFVDTTIVSSTSDFGAQFASWTTGATDKVYVACGCSTGSHSWNGTAKTALTASGTGQWQDDLLNPNGTHMPSARHVVAHNEMLWVAWTGENSQMYPDRVRFSHPLFPESWRENDFIDIVQGGRGITAIVPFGGHLVIFKDHAVFALYGYSAETFQVVEITRELGAPSPQAVAVNESGVYFFDGVNGLFRYDGRTVEYMFENLKPLLDLSEYNTAALTQIRVSAVGTKVYLSLPAGESTSAETYVMPSVTYADSDTLYPGSGTTYEAAGFTYDDTDLKFDGQVRSVLPAVTYVWDATVGKRGAWTRYKLADGFGLGHGVQFVDDDNRFRELFVHPAKPFVLFFDTNVFSDALDGEPNIFQSFYTTSWQDAGRSDARKFWRRPVFVLNRTRDEYELDVSVFRDWDGLDVARSFELQSAAYGSGGGQTWVAGYGSDVSKGNALGLGRAVQLRVAGRGGYYWGLNGVTFHYNPRGVKP